MKNIKKLLVAAILILGVSSTTYAQKIAHINTGDLIKSMPEMKTAQSTIEKLGKTYETDIQAMMTEYQNKMKQYEAEATTKTESENKKRFEEVQGMQIKIQQFQAQAQQELQKKELDLLKPITEKAKNAILKVAKSKGFQYVLDSTQGGGLIMAEGTDLIGDVKRELGI